MARFKHLGALIGHGYFIALNPGETEEAILKRFLEAADAGDEIAAQALHDCASIATLPTLGHHSGAHLVVKPNRGCYINPAHYPPAFARGGGMKFLEATRDKNIAARIQLAYLMRLRMTQPETLIY